MDQRIKTFEEKLEKLCHNQDLFFKAVMEMKDIMEVHQKRFDFFSLHARGNTVRMGLYHIFEKILKDCQEDYEPLSFATPNYYQKRFEAFTDLDANKVKKHLPMGKARACLCIEAVVAALARQEPVLQVYKGEEEQQFEVFLDMCKEALGSQDTWITRQ